MNIYIFVITVVIPLSFINGHFGKPWIFLFSSHLIFSMSIHLQFSFYWFASFMFCSLNNIHFDHLSYCLILENLLNALLATDYFLSNYASVYWDYTLIQWQVRGTKYWAFLLVSSIRVPYLQPSKSLIIYVYLVC